MMRVFAVIAALGFGPCHADSVVATRLVRAQSVLAMSDLTLVAAEIPGALTRPEDAIGQEAKVTLYPGRAIRPADLGAPALVDRNQIVPLTYSSNGLGITTDGRALARGAEGEVIRVMNLSSRNTVFGRVAADGTVQVGPDP